MLDIADFWNSTVFHNKTDLQFHCVDRADPNGWFMEFGVFRAESLNRWANRHKNIHFYGFDSWQGNPEPWHLTETIIVKEGYFKTHKPGVHDNVTLVDGYFQDSLPKWLEENATKDSYASFIHMDPDLYSSAKFVLCEMNPYIKTGTYILFDELSDFTPKQDAYTLWRDGEWKALCEWVEEFDRDFTVVGHDSTYRAAILVK